MRPDITLNQNPNFTGYKATNGTFYAYENPSSLRLDDSSV